jgi:hypothetical protein
VISEDRQAEQVCGDLVRRRGGGVGCCWCALGKSAIFSEDYHWFLENVGFLPKDYHHFKEYHDF